MATSPLSLPILLKKTEDGLHLYRAPTGALVGLWQGRTVSVERTPHLPLEKVEQAKGTLAECSLSFDPEAPTPVVRINFPLRGGGISSSKPIPVEKTHHIIPIFSHIGFVFEELPARNPHFVGREADLKEIERRMNGSDPKTGLTQVVIFGNPGEGKLSLAVEYFYQYRGQRNFFWQISAEYLADGFKRLGESLGITQPTDENETAIQTIKKWLEENPADWLIAIVNARGSTDLSRFLPSRGQIIIVTDDIRLSKGGMYLKGLSPKESLTLLTGQKAEEPRAPIVPVIFEKNPARNPNFVGRESALQKIEQKMKESDPKTSLNQVVIFGTPGTGRLSVAVEYFYRHLDPKNFFWQISAKYLAEGFRKIGESLGITQPTDEDETAIQKVKKWLEENPADWLIAIVNADRSNDLSPFIPSKGRILITTEDVKVAEGTMCISLEGLSPEESLTLLSTLTGQKRGTEEELKSLTALLKHHPQSLIEAAANLQEKTWEEYIQKIEKENELKYLAALLVHRPKSLIEAAERMRENNTSCKEYIQKTQKSFWKR